MVKRYNRLLAVFYIVSDSGLGVLAFVLAYVLRFETGIVPVTKGYPPFAQYVAILPVIAAVVPFAYYLQGLYRLRRGRSRVDDFFAVLVGSILAVVFGMFSTVYFQTYYASEAVKLRGALQSRKSTSTAT
jgi:FlaA1/EpsC-like NDP-sugar epimerase